MDINLHLPFVVVSHVGTSGIRRISRLPRKHFFPLSLFLAFFFSSLLFSPTSSLQPHLVFSHVLLLAHLIHSLSSTNRRNGDHPAGHRAR